MLPGSGITDWSRRPTMMKAKIPSLCAISRAAEKMNEAGDIGGATAVLEAAGGSDVVCLGQNKEVMNKGR
jgi:hypothetical protein